MAELVGDASAVPLSVALLLLVDDSVAKELAL